MALLLLALALAAQASEPLLDRADAALAEGRTAEAVQLASQAANSARGRGDRALEGRAENLLGGACTYAGEYERAAGHYGTALARFRELGDARLEIDVLNNLGSVWFFLGRYDEAWRTYAEASARLDTAGRQPWRTSAQQLTDVNRAALLQKLGRHEEALGLYRRVLARDGGLHPGEQARLLGNYGALLRRLGDPVKAAETYERALRLPADLDTTLGIRKNLGIVLGLDLAKRREAVEELNRAARDAERAGNARESLQARIYAAEIARLGGARVETGSLIAEARKRNLFEELWKALLIQARAEESAQALDEAVAVIEQVRPGRRSAAPRAAFLQDRAEPYDERIRALGRTQATPATLLYWHERLRARVFSEETGAAPPDEKLLGGIQARLQPGDALVSLRIARGQGSMVWAGRDSARAFWFDPPPESRIGQCWSELRNPALPPGSCDAVLRSLPPLGGSKRLFVASDGPLALFPFDAMANASLEVVHLPSARFLLRGDSPPPVAWPWKMVTASFAPALAAGRLPGDESWQPLVHASEEVRDVPRRMPGRAVIHEGADASRERLLAELGRAAVVHVAAHAAADAEDAGRTRLLLADGYLYSTSLPAVTYPQLRLVTLSACESAAGPSLEGEGLLNWARFLLARGAHATVGTLWKVDDRASFLLMQRFYRGLGEGLPASEALAGAKRELASSRAWSHPRYWAGFVLIGHPGAAVRTAGLPWWALAPVLLALTALALRRRAGSGTKRPA